jgi:antitoxin ChpS
MTIPAEVLRALQIEVGAELDIALSGEAFIATPRPKSARKRYSLRELLRGATPEAMRRLNDETACAREGGPVGQEL